MFKTDLEEGKVGEDVVKKYLEDTEQFTSVRKMVVR